MPIRQAHPIELIRSFKPEPEPEPEPAKLR
jgi:hypothetical protein